MLERTNDENGKHYQLAVAGDVANQIDLDAAMVLARSAFRAVAAIGLPNETAFRPFALEEVPRLEMACTDAAEGSIALILDALSLSA